MPSTPRLVHAWPGPTPTRTPTAPVRMRCSAVEYEAHPPTMTGISNSRMNFFRLSGWRAGSFDTCSADTTVPCTTRMSSSASRMCFAYCSTRCGVSDAHAVTPASLISRMRCADQLFLDRLVVELLHPARRLLGVERRDLVEHGVGVLVPGPEPFEVQARHAAELADLDRDLGRHHAVHRRADQREVEVERVDVPGDVDVLGISRAPTRDDRDVVEAVGLPTRLPDADLDFHPG